MGKLANDATKLLESISYQLIVTLEYCHSLGEGQSLWLERYGDVTVDGDAQVEVKNFSDDLTDGHINFWNTLKNWMAPGFKQEKYSELILLTTQQYGVTAKLRHWNEMTLESRMQLLTDVRSASEVRSAALGGKKFSKSVKAQQFVLAGERYAKLVDVLEKLKIVSGEPDLESRAIRARTKYGMGLDPLKRGDYFEAMLGYLIEPGMIKKGWEVTYEEFDMKVAVLRARYSRNSRKFPKVESADFLGRVDESAYSQRLFVKKLHEIDYRAKVPSAILHHIIATHTLVEEFKRFTIDKDDINSYKNNQLRRHISLREAAVKLCRRQEEKYWSENSQIFFDTRHGESVDPFPTFDDTAIEFRNGIWHIIADEPDDDGEEKIHWRLW